VRRGEALYIKTCNLIVSMTIHIHSPNPHSEVDSMTCPEDMEEKIIAVRVTHTSGQGCGRLSVSIRRCMGILHPDSGGPAFLHSTRCAPALIP
jgi:hypothetical protein